MVLLDISNSISVWERIAEMGIVAVLMAVAIVFLIKEKKSEKKASDKKIESKDTEISSLNKTNLEKIESLNKNKDDQLNLLAKEKNDQIEKQNDYIRENDKENLIVLSDVNKTLDKMIETQKVLNDRVIDHQKSSTDSIEDKLQNLKDLIEVKMDGIIGRLGSN